MTSSLTLEKATVRVDTIPMEVYQNFARAQEAREAYDKQAPRPLAGISSYVQGSVSSTRCNLKAMELFRDWTYQWSDCGSMPEVSTALSFFYSSQWVRWIGTAATRFEAFLSLSPEELEHVPARDIKRLKAFFSWTQGSLKKDLEHIQSQILRFQRQ